MRRNPTLVVALLVTALCAGLFAAHRADLVTIPGLEAAELATLHARFRLRGPRAPRGEDITVVLADRVSAELVAALGRYQPIAIGIAAETTGGDDLAGAVARAGVVVLPASDPAGARARARGVLDVATPVAPDALGVAVARLRYVDPRALKVRGDQLDHLGPAGTFPIVDSRDVIAGRATRERLAGKLLLVGNGEPVHDTPFGRLSTVELHAAVAHNAMHGELLPRPAAAGLAAIALLGALVAAAWRHARRRPLFVLALGLTYVFAAELMFDLGVVVEIVAPIAAVLIVAVAASFTHRRAAS
jgi:CHASE2 domain-containing sensor protein